MSTLVLDLLILDPMSSSFIIVHHDEHSELREFQKNIYFCFIDYAKAFDCVDHKKLWEILNPDPSSKATLWVKAQHEGALTHLCIIQVVWYSHLLKNFLQFVVIHTVKGFSIVSAAEVDVFLEFSNFFNDPTGCWQIGL